MLVKEFIAAAYPEDLEISIRANATIDRYGNNPMYFGKIKDFGKENSMDTLVIQKSQDSFAY